MIIKNGRKQRWAEKVNYDTFVKAFFPWGGPGWGSLFRGVDDFWNFVCIEEGSENSSKIRMLIIDAPSIKRVFNYFN